MTTGQGLSAIGWFLAIVVLIPLLLWMFKRSPMGRNLGQGPMRQTGTLALTPQARVVTVEIGQGDERRWLVLGVTAANVNLLYMLSPPDAGDAPPAAPTTPAEGFAQLLTRIKGSPGDGLPR
jgi:flagellar protein FliO/FliZ